MAAYEKEYAELGLAKDDVGSIELFYLSEIQNLQVGVKNKEGILIAEADTTLPSGGSGGCSMYVHSIHLSIGDAALDDGFFSFIDSSSVPLTQAAELTVQGVYPIVGYDGTITVSYINGQDIPEGPSFILDKGDVIPVDKADCKLFIDNVTEL